MPASNFLGVWLLSTYVFFCNFSVMLSVSFFDLLTLMYEMRG